MIKRCKKCGYIFGWDDKYAINYPHNPLTCRWMDKRVKFRNKLLPFTGTVTNVEITSAIKNEGYITVNIKIKKFRFSIIVTNYDLILVH